MSAYFRARLAPVGDSFLPFAFQLGTPLLVMFACCSILVAYWRCTAELFAGAVAGHLEVCAQLAVIVMQLCMYVSVILSVSVKESKFAWSLARTS